MDADAFATREITYRIEGDHEQCKATVHVYDEVEDIIAQIGKEKSRPNLCAWSIEGSRYCLPLNIRFVDIDKPQNVYVFRETLTRQVIWKAKGEAQRKELLTLSKNTTFNDIWQSHGAKSVTSVKVNGRRVNVVDPLVDLFGSLPEPWKPVEIEVDTCDVSEKFKVVRIVNGEFGKWENVCLGWNGCWDTLRDGLGVTAVFDKKGEWKTGTASEKPTEVVYALKLSNCQFKPEDLSQVLGEREFTSMKLYREFVHWDDESLRTIICYVMYWMLSGPGTTELQKKFGVNKQLSFPPFTRSFERLTTGEQGLSRMDLAVILETINAYVKAKKETISNFGNVCSKLLKTTEETEKESPFAEIPENMVLEGSRMGMCVVQSKRLFLGTGSGDSRVFLCPDEDGAKVKDLSDGGAGKDSLDLPCQSELTVVFIDNSGTMLTQFGKHDISKIEAVNKMVNKMVDIVDEHISKNKLPCRYSYVFMSDIVGKEDAPDKLPDFGKELRDRLSNRDNRCRKTRIWTSMSKLIKKVSAEPGQHKRILVLTDGEDKSNDQKKVTVLQEARNNNIIIDGIVFGNEEDTNEFACACRLTGGIAFRFVDVEQIEDFANRPGFIDFMERGNKASTIDLAHEDEVLTRLSKIVNFNTHIEPESFDVSYPKILKRTSKMPAANLQIQEIVKKMTTMSGEKGVEEVLYWDDPHMWCVILSIAAGDDKIPVYWDLIVRFPLTYPHLPAEFLFRHNNRYIEDHVDSQRRWKATSKTPVETLRNITATLKTAMAKVDINELKRDCNARFPIIESPFTSMELFTRCHMIEGEKAAKPQVADNQSQITLKIPDHSQKCATWRGIQCLGTEKTLLDKLIK